MEEDEQEQRRRKVEAGRAKLAHFRQRKTEGDGAHPKKKTAKRKGPAVDAPVQEESPVAAEDGVLLGGRGVCRSSVCGNLPAGAGAAPLEDPDPERTEDSEPQQKLDGDHLEQPGVITKPLPPLELEALRLSLSDLHAAQLELTQANLQREKETALTELRQMLNSRHAQELALLRSQTRRELEEMALHHSRETAELKEKLQSEVEKNAQMIETLKQDWESERSKCLENLRRELLEKHQSELENLQNQYKKELAEQKAELEKIFHAQNQAELSLRTQEAQHEVALRQLRADLQRERVQCLEDLELKFREGEKESQLELENLRVSYEELQAQSQEEIQRLWVQLESARSSRQELSELHDQLLARTSHVEELERLRRDFEQQQQQERTKHESELGQLRIYFEKKLREAEKDYQEDLALFQQRLQEMEEDSLLESVQIRAPSEEMSGKERDHLDQLSLHLEQHEESLCLPRLEENRWCQLAVRKCCLEVQQDVDLVGPPVLEGEQPVGPSGEPDQELARVPLLCAQNGALEAQAQVVAGVSHVGPEHKAQLSLLQMLLQDEVDLLRVENRSLREKLQREARLREDLEEGKRNLVEDHQAELKSAEERIELVKQELRDREAEWNVTSEGLRQGAEERLARVFLDLREQAESEKRSLTDRFELREAEMRQLQDQQAAQILALEGSLTEQQGRLRQLELSLAGDESLRCSQCGRELAGGLGPADQEREPKEDSDHLQPAQSRFLGERREITEKFIEERDAFLQEAQEKQASELQLLRERHQQLVLSLRAELETRHQAELEELRASFQSERRARSDAREAELQAELAAEIRALEARHVSHLDSLESRYLSDIQTLRGQHRRALELLRVDLEEQLQKEAAPHHVILTRAFKKLELQQEDAPASAEELGMARTGALRGAHQGEFEGEKKAALWEEEETHRPEQEQVQSRHQKEKESLSLQLQEKDHQILQLQDQILSLNHEIEECHSELERLQQRRERENQEGTNLISMLKSDIDLSHGERRALRDALRRLLGLFGETLEAAVALRSRIGERVGLCLEEESPPDAPAASVPDETWPGLDAAPPELDRTSPECAETSSVAEISSHIRESFFMSPESTLECEQPIRRVYRSLGLAVDSLLEMVLDSTRQLEEARQIHSRLERELSCKSEETAQVVRKHQELLECLDAESTAKTRLTLELHEAGGIIEGFKEEKAGLQEALGRKEASERSLVVELEGLQQQLQRATQQLAELQEENHALQGQKEAMTVAAGEREAGLPVTVAHKDSALRREVDSLTEEQSEARKQCEKDRSALLAQMRVLEAELEEQLSRHQACARQAEELSALSQQMGSLDKQLRRQRQFMDEQAAEREQEREEFQQEIQRLEEQLRQAARLQPRGPCDSDRQWTQLDEEVELLEEKLREKSDGLNELILKKELADRQVLIQEEEIRRLKETNASTARRLVQLQEDLERQRRTVQDLEQDKAALQEQQMSNLLLVSTLQSRLDEGKCPVPPAGSSLEGPEVRLEALQRALLEREDEVLDLKEQLEKTKHDLVSRNEEVLHLDWTLGVQDSSAATRIRELQEESAGLKAFLQNKEREMTCVSEQNEQQLAGTGYGALSEVMCDRGSEIEELKSIIENLRENQERLQKDRAEEVDQLHEVIEKLQRELSIAGPALHEVSGGDSGGAGSLKNELLGLQAEGAAAREVLEGELHTALEAKEALGRLLSEQERLHGQALEALQGRLRDAEEAAARRLAQLEQSAALREAEVQGLASQIREFEAALKAKDVKIAERDLEIEAVNKERRAHSSELEALLSAVARFRHALEQQPLAAAEEPPELQRLRAQCRRLSRQLQVLHQQFVRCQRELDREQVCGVHPPPCMDDSTQCQAPCDEGLEQEAPHGHGGDPQSPATADLQPAKALVTLNRAGLCKQDDVMSVLTVCQRLLESELLLVKKEMCSRVEDHDHVSGTDKGELLEGCQLRKADLIAQARQLQEKLSRLVHSMSFPDVDVETKGFTSQQALASSHVLENSLSDGSSNSEETGSSPPVDAFSVDTTTWDLVDAVGSQGSWLRSGMLDAPTVEQVAAQEGSLCSQVGSLRCLPDPAHAEGPEPLKLGLRTMDLASWSSPEVARKDSTLEPMPSLPLTPCSDALSQRSLDTSLWDGTGTSLLQADQSGLLCYPGESTAGMAPRWAESPLAADRTPSTDHHAQRGAVEKDVEDFIVTSLDFQEKSRSPPLGLEGESAEKSAGSGSGEMLAHGSGRLGAPTAGPAAPPAPRGFRRSLVTVKKEVHPKQVKALLQMVCDESHHILALSECRGPPSVLSRGEPSTPLERLPQGCRGLLEAAAPLRGHPTPAPQKGEKEPSDLGLDWRGEFLQVVQEAFEKEREMLKVELRPRLCGSDVGGCSTLLERLEKVVQEQGGLQEKSLEHLHLSDRSRLLSEIQALRAQLRMTHLQNQEKLQQLCVALTNTEARGSRREHQLRRQVELLAYKVEQEKCIASDLQKTLNEEQEKANHVRKLLVVEQSAVRDLKSELCECKQDNERLLRSLNDVQKEVLQLRSVLDSKEKDLANALQQLEGERVKGQALQSRLEEERLQYLQREGQSAKTLEELRTSLEKQFAHSNQLCVALEHEQTAKDNLRKELQIETSRCEALLAQERGHLSELQRSLEAEQGRARELSEALHHERLLTERLSRRAQEKQAHQALLQKLKSQGARVRELEVALDTARRRAQEAEREQEVSAVPRPTVEALQTLERERERPARGQAELEQPHAGRAEQEGRKAARTGAELRPSRADAHKWRRWQRDKETLRELELQHQRDEHKIQQLQRTLREQQAGARPCPTEAAGMAETEAEAERLREQQLGLEKVRQQLLCAAGLLTSFINQMVDRTISDWTSSNEKAVASLLHTLETLKSELGASSSCRKKTAAELQVQLVDVLLKDNESLTRALSAVTREKAELHRALSQLERPPRGCARKGCSAQHGVQAVPLMLGHMPAHAALSARCLALGRVAAMWGPPTGVQRSDRSVWRQDRTVSPSSARPPDPALPTPEVAKMEKLYLRYLRAESFRKALIYQKKYLLLLIGGFQDSEQETLSMIAHLGVFPSKAEKGAVASRPLTKFRTAVRVVIAVLRLRFLVKKWQQVDGRGAVVPGWARTGPPVPQRQQSSPDASESPPTRDVSSSHARDPVAKASPRRRERSERSLTASQDPEHSLTEYIHHLEMIQQRLEGVPPDSTSKKPCYQKTKQ
nr:pericentrin isoform X3 [Camelus dromedarius]